MVTDLLDAGRLGPARGLRAAEVLVLVDGDASHLTSYQK
jgi:hypothetical protein